MDKLQYLGELSEQSKIEQWSIATLNDTLREQVLEEIGQLLHSSIFSKKASVKGQNCWRELKLSIKIEKQEIIIKHIQTFGKRYVKSCNAPIAIKSLTLQQLKEMPDLNGSPILPHTIETHDCDKEMVCPSCKGNGACSDCSGERYVVCDNCDGSGECPDCEGSGRYPCYSCDQTGNCSYCEGSGTKDCNICGGDGWITYNQTCYDCNGTGQYRLKSGRYVECRSCNGSGSYTRTKGCYNCGGTGTVNCRHCGGDGVCQKCDGGGDVKCRACKGTGKCGKCKGKGKLRCQTCNASGACARCNGKGKVLCTVCHGTGYYQTFDAILFKYGNRELILRDKQSEVAVISQIKTKQLYAGTPYQIEFSKVTMDEEPLLNVLQTCDNKDYLKKMKEFKSTMIDENGKAVLPENVYMQTNVNVEGIDVKKLSVEFFGSSYTFYVVGDNHAVYCNDKPSLWQRFWAHFF